MCLSKVSKEAKNDQTYPTNMLLILPRDLIAPNQFTTLTMNMENPQNHSESIS